MNSSKLGAMLLAGIATLAITPAVAQAQTTNGVNTTGVTATGATTDAPATADQADPATNGNEVVVTAQRRSENTLAVPVAVSVIRPETLHDYDAAGGDTLLSLSGKVPNLYVESSTGRIFPRFYIRGLGNIDFYLGASQPVEVIQDDVVLEHVVLKSNPAYDKIGRAHV